MQLNQNDLIIKQQWEIDRLTPEYQAVFTKPEPLVSVVMTTFNACNMLINHSLKGILNQTYKNLQIIIIDDGSTDDTEYMINLIHDKRVIYHKLIDRDKSKDTWFTCGAFASNYGLDFCTGDFVCHCDDDDFFLFEKIEKLVRFCQDGKYESIHHPFIIHRNPPGTVINIDSKHYAAGFLATSTLFYHGWFKRIKIDLNAEEQGDWAKARKMMQIGAKIGRYPEVLTILNQKYCYDGHSRAQPESGWVQKI